jgi:hypothetical protein
MGVPSLGDCREPGCGGAEGARRRDDDAMQTGRAENLAPAEERVALHVLAAVEAVESELGWGGIHCVHRFSSFSCLQLLPVMRKTEQEPIRTTKYTNYTKERLIKAEE